MPNPLDKSSPRFRGKEPEGLYRFWERMEKLLDEAQIVDGDKRIEKIIEYVDDQAAREWKSFEAYGKKSFKDFKEEVFENYPEALEYAKGARVRIEKICFEYRGLKQSEPLHLC